MNGGCVVVGRPRPSHPFIAPHPTVYETARVARKIKNLMDGILADEKSMFAK